MTRVALVTGGTRGIGRAISETMKTKGYAVAANFAGNQQAADECAKELGINCYKFDVADYDAVTEGLAQIEKELGPVDVVVNNAGVTRDKTIANMSEQFWQMTLDINLAAAQRITNELLSSGALNDGGSIVGVSSMNGIGGQRGQTNYAASKAGVIGYVAVSYTHLTLPTTPYV